MTFGSSPENDWAVAGKGVSRLHLEFEVEGGRVRVKDVGSKNGAYLNGIKVTEAVIEEGDTLYVGEARIELREMASADGELAIDLGYPTPDPDHVRDDGVATFVAPSGNGGGGDENEDSLVGGTDAVGPQAQGSSREGLELLRRLGRMPKPERQRRRSEVLNRALEILSVDSLFLSWQDSDGYATVLEMAGLLPPPSLFSGLGPLLRPRAGAGPEGQKLRVSWVDKAGVAVQPPADSGPALVAVFSDTAPPAAEWTQEFMRYLLEGLSGDEADGPEARGPAELVFPKDMVGGTSPAIRAVRESIKKSIGSQLNVLLHGQTGSGKEIYARMIHLSSPHADGPFVAINCAAIPHDLLEAELFGVVKGTATGVGPRDGRFVQAHGGTLFLDEVTELPLNVQAKMLRVLQEREVLKLGGTKPVAVDVRVVSATNQDLRGLVEDRLFRPDLFYRLVGLEFRLPPLRERREDIPAFITEFVSRSSGHLGKRLRGVSRGAFDLLTEYDWPGNVRELATMIERAVLIASEGEVLSSHHFADLIPLAVKSASGEGAGEEKPEAGSGDSPGAATAGLGDLHPHPEPGNGTFPTMKARLDAVQRVAIEEALTVTDGNKSAAARLLEVSRNGLSEMILRLEIKT